MNGRGGVGTRIARTNSYGNFTLWLRPRHAGEASLQDAGSSATPCRGHPVCHAGYRETLPINALRSHLAEFGIVAAKGRRKAADLIATLDELAIPGLARIALRELAEQIDACDQRIMTMEKEIFAWHKTNEASRNLATIPGIGPITATMLAATITDPAAFKSGRQLAAWVGLVPRQNSSGGKDRLGSITKAGDRSIRRLLVMGATSVIRYARTKAPGDSDWLKGLLDRKPARLVTVALANKMARIAWAVLTRGEVYQENFCASSVARS